MNMKELIEIQKSLKCNKARENKFGGYKYRSCEDIMEAVKPLLSEQSCTLTVTDEVVMVGDRTYIKATATLANAEEKTVQVSAFAREEEAKKGMDVAQITGSASSYARKYALNGLFCIDDGHDPDAMDNRDMGGRKTAKKTEVEQMRNHINNAATMDDLKMLWDSCDAAMRSQLTPVFTEAKKKMQESYQDGTAQH